MQSGPSDISDKQDGITSWWSSMSSKMMMSALAEERMVVVVMVVVVFKQKLNEATILLTP